MTTRKRVPFAAAGILALTLGAGLTIAGTHPAFASSAEEGASASAVGYATEDATSVSAPNAAQPWGSCPSLVSLEATTITDTSVTVEWVVADGVTYDHFKLTGVGDANTVLGPEVRKYEITGFSPGSLFNVNIVPTCADGSYDISTVIVRTTGPNASVDSTSFGAGAAVAATAGDASGTATAVGGTAGDTTGSSVTSAGAGDASVGGSNADASIGGTTDASSAAGSEGAAAAAGVSVAGEIEPTAATTSTLANTGSDLSASLLALGGLLTVGGLATLTVLTAKRRRATL